MASNSWRLHVGGVRLLISVLLLFSKPQATHTAAEPTAHHNQLKKDTPAERRSGAAEPAVAVGATALPSGESAKGSTAAEVKMFDFSFSPVGPHGLQDTYAKAAAGAGDGDVEQEPHSAAAVPPSALSLRECSLGDVGVAEFARSPWVCGRTGVRALSLRQNQVTAVGMRALMESLRSSTDSDRLACLELDFNPIGDAGAQPLPAYLKERAERGGGGLEELSLRFCDIGPAGCRYLSSALLKSATAAKIADNSDTGTDNDNDNQPIGGVSTERGEDEQVDGEMETGGDGGYSLPPPVASGIRRLLLTGNNRLGDAGVRALASALKKDCSLEVLDLTRCKIGDDGVRYLADALRSNSCLRELRLGYNDISADGAFALASLLHAGSSVLECLELQGNHVGDAGAVALANSLAGGTKRGRRGAKQGRRGPGLRSLNLAGNGIGCAGGGALAKALSPGKGGGGGGGVVLEELELAGNALTLSASQAAAQGKNSSLYKSAGGALSSLLNTFVDESYYSSSSSTSSTNTKSRGSQEALASSPPSLANPTAAGASENPANRPRCAIAELGDALGGQGGRGGGRDGRCSSLKALGLARTGMTERDAVRLASTLRARPVDSPLEEVEVAMNGLSFKAAEAVRLAVESPAVPIERGSSDDFEARSRGGRRRRRPGGRDPAAFAGAGEHQPKPQSRGEATRAAAAGERDARAEVGEYVPPGGSVELGLFGKKIASFRQVRGSGRELDVEVFGKRVRFERSGAPSPRSPPPPPAMEESDPWSEDDGVEFGDVSTAATHGSAFSSSSEDDDGAADTHLDKEGEDAGGDGRSDTRPVELGSGDPENSGSADTEDWGDQTSDGDYSDVEERRASGGTAASGEKPGRRTQTSPRISTMRGGGGGGGVPPIESTGGQRRPLRFKGKVGDGDDGVLCRGLKAVSEEAEEDCESMAASAEIEWEAGFEEQPPSTSNGVADQDRDGGEWAGGADPLWAEQTGENADAGGAAASAEMEWNAGFGNTELGGDFSADGDAQGGG